MDDLPRNGWAASPGIGGRLTSEYASASYVPEDHVPEGHTTLHWLRQGATASSPQAIQNATAKLTFLREIGAAGWDLSALNPNRVRRLAALGRRYTSQALRRLGPERRYPILVCFLRRAFVETIDEAADLFDECMQAVHRRSKRALREEHEAARRATEEKVRLFYQVGCLVLDGSIPDGELRQAVFRRISPLELSAAVDEAEAIMRPAGISYFDFLESRFSYLRQFVPAFLEAMPLKATRRGDPVMEGVEVLRRMNREGKRKVPGEAPTRFVPRKWQPFVFEENAAAGDGAPAQDVNRRGWELCLLTELQGRLRSGDVYLTPSRRYADPETYLISKEAWPALREEVAGELGTPTDGAVRIQERRSELEALLLGVGRLVRGSGEASVRFEGGQLVVSPLPAAEEDPRVEALKGAVTERLPRVGLAGLLVEVDALTGFSRHLTRPGSQTMRKEKLLPSLYAAIVAHGTGMGPAQMAQSSGISYDRLAWTSTWHLREETLKAAVTELVNFHDRQALTALWGRGTLSSSDGQRFPVRGKVRRGRPLPRYFGYGRGVTFYTWTSDQYSQFGTQVIPSTVRDATYVLDEILDNESDLSPTEHAVDTAGTTEIIFALFDLLSLRFSPRIRDLGEQRLYQAGGMEVPGPLGSRFRSKVNLGMIEEGWDDLLRIAGSLKRGHCPASLLVSKLQAYPRQNRLTRLLQEYGRLVKTVFILRYLKSEALRRRIHAQLNKSEALHELRRFLFFGQGGVIRRKSEEALADQALCLSLLTNAVVVWNTLYIEAATDRLRGEGVEITGEDLARLSPARSAHIGRYGRYRFDLDRARRQAGLRPLREPKG